MNGMAKNALAQWERNVKRKLQPLLAAGLIVATIATPLLAAPADVVKSRIASYRELGAAFKNVNDALRGPNPPAVILQLSSREIMSAARAQGGWFPAGSGPQPGIKTRAKAEIWTQAPRFRAAQAAFATQAASFDRAVKTGNVTAIRAEARKLGGTCKGCHDQFRTPDE